jgi:hypothetical protein
VDLIFHYDDEEYLTRAIRDTDGDGELDQILHFNRDGEIIKVEKIRSDDTRNSILFIILGSILFFLVMCFWLYVTKKQSYNSKMNELNYMGRINHQLGRRLILILISFLIIFVLFVPPVSSLEDAIDDDCNIIQDVFDRDWKKYSNLENTPYTFEEYPLTARSWETQQYYATQSKIVDAKVQIFFLKRDMEINRRIQLELKEYKKELVDGNRDNLLKSFMRLSFLTVHTTWEAYQGGKSLFGTPKAPGGSYVNLFTTPSNLAAGGSVLKITDTYKSMAPPESTALAKDTQRITKLVDVDTVSKNVAYEALETLADPTKVGVTLVTGVIDAVPIPHKAKDWKLTDDDFNILREEHLEMKRIGKAITKSNKVHLERQDKVRELKAQIKELEKELAEWEAKEKSRVADRLVFTCKERKGEDEEESKTPTYLIWIDKYGNAGRIHVGTKEEFERPKKYKNEWLAGISDEYLEKERIGGPFESMDEATNKACEMITDPHYKYILGWGRVPYAKYGGKTYHIDSDLGNRCMPP